LALVRIDREVMAKAAMTFALYRGDALIHRETVSQDIVKVGNDPKSHLRVDDPEASRMHAVIEVAGPEEITLIDLGNEPGTLVNGARVNKCKLHVGDQIQVGSTIIVLESAEAVAVAPSPFAPAPSAAQASNPFAGASASNPFAAATGSSPFAAASSPFAAASAPFAAAAYQSSVPDDAPPGTYTYTLLKSGPDVSPDEVELPHVQSLEVMVLWGTNVLHVSHLTPPRSFYVGEEQGKNFACDFFIPSERLATTRLPLVVGDQASLSLIIPPGATGYVEVPGQARLTLDEARARSQPSAEVSGGHQLPFGGGAKAKIELNGFVFQIAAVNAGKPVKKGVSAVWDWTMAAFFGASFLSVASFVAAMAFFVPPFGLTDEEGIDRHRLFLMQQYLDSAAEREQQEKEAEVVEETNADNKEGGTGTRAKGEEGSMGNPTTKATNKRYAVQGPKDNPDPHLARQAALREATEFGMIGLLNTGAAGDPNAPTAPWGRDTSLGMDDISARGNMWGDEIGDAFGAGGLGLSGIGEGGGGRGEGIGLGNIGTLGHGAGTGTGQGFGSGHGRLGGSHKTRAPKVRMGQTTVSGRLPPEVIQRIVRQNYGRFRMCFEQGLVRNPNLEGRVSVRFVIGRDGSVSNVANGGSDLPDSQVISCVISAYYGLSFPQPEGGIVTVVYPIMFSPG
jgi:pSer/pThr/pTyr-binding forkhead associated (FHA) protein